MAINRCVAIVLFCAMMGVAQAGALGGNIYQFEDAFNAASKQLALNERIQLQGCSEGGTPESGYGRGCSYKFVPDNESLMRHTDILVSSNLGHTRDAAGAFGTVRLIEMTLFPELHSPPEPADVSRLKRAMLVLMTVYSPNATALEKAATLKTLFKNPRSEETTLHGVRWWVGKPVG